jgi:hypothetical protein
MCLPKWWTECVASTPSSIEAIRIELFLMGEFDLRTFTFRPTSRNIEDWRVAETLADLRPIAHTSICVSEAAKRQDVGIRSPDFSDPIPCRAHRCSCNGHGMTAHRLFEAGKNAHSWEV